MKSSKNKDKRKQSNLSRALASSNRIDIVHKRFFENLTSGEIRRSVPGLIKHRHFAMAMKPNEQGYKNLYASHTPDIGLEKNVAWCLGLLEAQKENIEIFIRAQGQLLEFLLAEKFDAALEVVNMVELKTGVSAWSVSLTGTLLTMAHPEERHGYITKVISSSGDNSFFKSLTYHITNRFDDPETLLSESRFFELKIRRSFAGELLHFLMYKLVTHNVEFSYDFEKILNFEKNSSPIDIYCCLLDFITFHVESKDDVLRDLCRKTISDLLRSFSHTNLEDLAVAYGIKGPSIIGDLSIRCIDLYTTGSYSSVCDLMDDSANLSLHFGLVEIWAKSLARLPNRKPKRLHHLLMPLVDVVTKSSNYERSRALLLAYCHALSMFKWFRELRYLLERETRFYGNEKNRSIRELSLLIGELSTPAKLQVLVDRGFIELSEARGLIPSGSVTARLFERMHSIDALLIQDADLDDIESTRKQKFQASWYLSGMRYLEAVPLLEQLVRSDDRRSAQDASRALVEAHRALGEIERAADVYVDAVLANEHLLSVFDTHGLCEACQGIIERSSSVSIPIALSLHSRLIGDKFDAALKYSFECYLKNSKVRNPIDLLSGMKNMSSKDLYFLRYVCIPEVMKLYLFFETPKQIEQCRIDICKVLLAQIEGDEDLIFEIKDRTRRMILRDASTQFHTSRIYSDANLLTGASSPAFRALYERYAQLRLQDFSGWEDEKALSYFHAMFKEEHLIQEHAHAIHLQDLVLNEKNSVFLKLVKLVRDEFVFGEKGLNVYLSTRIRHGHFPNTLRKPLLDNSLLASKATDTAGYKLSKNAAQVLKLPAETVVTVEASLIEFNVEFNKLIDEVNDKWLRIFTIDQDLSGLGKDAGIKKSLFNYSVTAIEAFNIQQELSAQASYPDFVTLVGMWLWARTEQNLRTIRMRISGEVTSRALLMLDELGRNATQRYGIYNLGSFPDALARTRNGLVQAFESVEGWFTRARGANIKSFELYVPVQIASAAMDISVELDDESGLFWNGGFLNPLVDAFYILFENAVSKSKIDKGSINVRVRSAIQDEILMISVENRCAIVDNISLANDELDRYRTPGESQKVVHAAQGEGGSGFFKLWRLLAKDMSVTAKLDLGFINSECFQVVLQMPSVDYERLCINENIARRG